MFIWKIRHKPTREFVKGIDMWGNLYTGFPGEVYSHSSGAYSVLDNIQQHHKELASYSDKGRNKEYAEKSKALRKGNFEVVTFFCTEQKKA